MKQHSILIPVYNQHPAFLRAALISAVKQTVDCEVIVVDDGSDIPCKEQVDAVRWTYGGDIVYHYQENQGVAGALNTALELSQGDFIQWLPSDDLFRLGKTECQCENMGDSEVSYTSYEEGVPVTQVTYPAANYPSQEMFFDALKAHCFINAATVMWRRDVFDEVGVWNTDIIHSQDGEYLLRCAERWNFVGVNEPLVRRRVHPGQMLNALSDEAEKAKKTADIEYINERYGATWNVWVPE